ncbi:MAG: hypothetical protein ACLSAH_03175 [Bilophila wadsworthia]
MLLLLPGTSRPVPAGFPAQTLPSYLYPAASGYAGAVSAFPPAPESLIGLLPHALDGFMTPGVVS